MKLKENIKHNHLYNNKERLRYKYLDTKEKL
jgi:hypothetical protein